jgi:hypothetical protein
VSDLYYSPAIVIGGVTWWLPPWVDVDSTRGQSVELISVPQSSTAIITSVQPNQGTHLNLVVSGMRAPHTQEDVLYWFEEMWDALSGPEKVFDLFIFSDRAWRGCALETQRDRIGLDPLVLIENTSLSIVCPYSKPDTNAQLTFTDYESEYPYANLVGRPRGSAVTPGGGTPLLQSSYQTPGGHFPGGDVVTPTGQEIRVTVGGTTGSQWTLEKLQVVSADPTDATGTTTVRVSTVPIGTVGGSQINATVGSTAYFGSPASGSIAVTAGSTLYVYIPTTGGHANVQFTLWLKAL